MSDPRAKAIAHGRLALIDPANHTTRCNLIIEADGSVSVAVIVSGFPDREIAEAYAEDLQHAFFPDRDGDE